MLLKRLYEQSETGASTVRGVKVLRAGPRQRFTRRLIDQGLAEGWLSMGQGKLTIHGAEGDVVFNIVRPPGTYCCHCDAAQPDGATAAQHVLIDHAALVSPDPTNPSGYRVEGFYTGVNAGAQVGDDHAAYDRQMREALAKKVVQKYGAVARRDVKKAEG